MKCKTLEEGNRLPHFCFAETASPTFTSLLFLETIATQNKEVFRPVMWACTRVFGDPCIVRLSPFFKYFSHLTPNSSYRGHHNFTHTYMFPLYRRQGLCTCNLLVLLEGSLFPPFFLFSALYGCFPSYLMAVPVLMYVMDLLSFFFLAFCLCGRLQGIFDVEFVILGDMAVGNFLKKKNLFIFFLILQLF